MADEVRYRVLVTCDDATGYVGGPDWLVAQRHATVFGTKREAADAAREWRDQYRATHSGSKPKVRFERVVGNA